jgi:hypothetical protein
MDNARLAFLLERMRPVLATYRPPDAAFSRSGAWEHVYELFSAPLGRFTPNGELRLRRTPLDGGGCRLAVDSRRRGSPGFSFFIHAEFDCGAGALGPLRNWTSSSKMAAAAGDPPYRNSGLRKQGVAAGDSVEVRTGSQKNRTKLAGPCLAKWCLIENVQRLPREQRSYAFTLLDEVDELHPAQELRFGGVMETAAGGAARTLGAFQHLGQGVIPTTYWTDDRNRVLFIATGVEAYVLKESNGRSAAYALDNPTVRPL